jgi:two-component system sensor histidine kinase CpxA
MISPEPRKIRFPLYAKILLWFLLNLVFLGIASYVILRVQFNLGLNSLLSGQMGDRIQAVSDVMSYNLNLAPKTNWNEIVRNYSSAYQVQFVLFRYDGVQVAGDPVTLPPEVQSKLKERFWPFTPTSRPSSEVRSGRVEPANARGTNRASLQPGPAYVRTPSKFVMHTANPSRYWVFVRIPVLDRGAPKSVPVSLLVVSDSLHGGGLFFDFLPWVGVGLGFVMVSLLFWIPLVRGITRSLSQLSQATEHIAEGRFEARVATHRRDELGHLGQAVNRMAGRLAGFVTGQKRFLGDIAHELCSPIARIQVALGILEQRADAKQKTYVEDVREEVQQMSSLVNELLSFSQAGLQHKEVKLEPVTLAELARRVVAREAAEAMPVEIQIEETLCAQAEPELLSRALANLVRNAIRYAGQAGSITIAADARDGRVTLTVTDSGPGVPEATVGQIFDPFFRLEASRSRDTGGAGLGLAIVKTCVEACQGTVTARNRLPSGLQVEIVLQQ